jgi:hypothetical protein
VRVWRICKEQYSSKSFSGDGGLKAAARWHHKGHRIVYTSQSLSLATIELWVHVDPEEPLFTYVAAGADIPDDLALHHLHEANLPSNWRDDPGPTELRDLGTTCLVMPTTYDGPSNDPGYLGGNLLISTTTPEPSSTGLMALGVFGIVLGLWQRRAGLKPLRGLKVHPSLPCV